MSQTHYQLKLLKLGAEVRGIVLNKEVDQEVIEQIKADVTKYRLMVFKNQGVVTAERQVEITKWFGEVDADIYMRHPRQKHPAVSRISNNPTEGALGVGSRGWHMDGNHKESPNPYTIYHIVSVSSTGDTLFAPLTEMLDGLPQEQYARWNRLWRVCKEKPGNIHPIVYYHPTTHKKIFLPPINTDWTEKFIWDYGTSQEQHTDIDETKAILKEFEVEFHNNKDDLQYTHKYEAGDVIIADNLALGHVASPGTQDPPEKVGLRILHRTNVKGTIRPSKDHVISHTKQ